MGCNVDRLEPADDIDAIDEAYLRAGGGGWPTQDCIIRPSWWRSKDRTQGEHAAMTGKAVEIAIVCSSAHEPSIKEVSVRNDGLHLIVLARKLVQKLDADGCPTAQVIAEPLPAGWLDDMVVRLKMRINALSDFWDGNHWTENKLFKEYAKSQQEVQDGQG